MRYRFIVKRASGFRSTWYRSMAVLAACALPCLVSAQTIYFPSNATSNSTVTGLVYVGKNSSNGNSSPTVQIVGGADLWQSAFSFNRNHINMNGGRVRESLIALDSSTVSITDGEIGRSLATRSDGTPTRRGGSILMSGGRAVNCAAGHSHRATRLDAVRNLGDSPVSREWSAS